MPGIRPRIFISYKRDVEPDQSLARELHRALSIHCDTFIDQLLPVGSRWAERINEELHRADYLVILLSAKSVQSEMVLGEVERAIQIGREREGRPAILPIRVAFRDALDYPLNAYLNPLNWSNWCSPADTPRLIEDLSIAVQEGQLSHTAIALDPPPPRQDGPPYAAAQPLAIELPEGTMDSESRYYVLRPTDTLALSTIRLQGVTLTIKAPRQMGKSSLLIRTLAEAARHQKRVAFLDFQLIDGAALASADVFFRQFSSWISDALEVQDDVAKYWESPLGNSQRCTRYMMRKILAESDAPLVLGMDEVDRIFNCPFRSDFFSMLRSWHNSRASSKAWKMLDLVLVTSTEPYQLIEDLNQSPFNVGQVMELADFSADQVRDLNCRHGSPLTEQQETNLMELLNGHPYLVRRALYLIADGRCTVPELFERAADDRGPFGDHLRYHLFRLHEREALIQGLRQIMKNGSCEDELVFFRLRGAGLVKRVGRTAVMRCPLYANYFREHLHV
jgi:AAA-like domain/TIR domain